jgi:dolichol kinase
VTTLGTTYPAEVGRKSIHLASALIPALYLILPHDWTVGLLGLALAIMIVIEGLRAVHPPFREFFEKWCGFMLRTAERQRLTGSTFVLVAALAAVLLFRKEIAIAVLFILSISDSLAAVVGRKFGGPRFVGNKSLGGSLAFFASALLIAMLCLPQRPVAALVGAAVATVVEAVPLRFGRLEIDDNLTVPLVAGAVMTLLVR